MFAAGVLFPCLARGYGLRTDFGKVVLENIPIGAEYSMRKDAKFPLVIENNSDSVVELKIEVLSPQADEVQKGYEPIPDIGWVRLEKDLFLIAPNGNAETDVVIRVPDREEYCGRKFHVFISSWTVGRSLGLGIKSKLLFGVKGKPVRRVE